MPSANCGRVANGVVLIAGCNFVGIDCKKVDANEIVPDHVVVVVELEIARVLEKIAHCGYTRVQWIDR